VTVDLQQDVLEARYIEPPAPNATARAQAAAAASPPAPAKPARNDFRFGEKVAEDKYLQTVVSTVVRS